jgi:tetratricopeptide (TPR) repeat protein
LVLLLLAAATFSLTTVVQPRAASWEKSRGSGSIVEAVLGDSRRLFANQLFVEADVSFHSGYYPSMFDEAQAPKDSRHMKAREGSSEAEEHERKMNFLGPPKDWIEKFGRNFMITEHTHLEGAQEREILPWLKLSADLDPQRADTYTVAAYWLRGMGKIKEAEQFLREGLRHNPGSYEILLELGNLYKENLQNPVRARNVWELALERWRNQESKKNDPDLIGLEQIAVRLARLEEQEGHLARAIGYLEMAAEASPSSQALQQQIAELKQKLASQPAAGK